MPLSLLFPLNSWGKTVAYRRNDLKYGVRKPEFKSSCVMAVCTWTSKSPCKLNFYKGGTKDTSPLSPDCYAAWAKVKRVLHTTHSSTAPNIWSVMVPFHRLSIFSRHTSLTPQTLTSCQPEAHVCKMSIWLGLIYNPRPKEGIFLYHQLKWSIRATLQRVESKWFLHLRKSFPMDSLVGPGTGQGLGSSEGQHRFQGKD